MSLENGATFHFLNVYVRIFFTQTDSTITVQRSALCRSRREHSNEHLLAKIGVDTAENELLEVLFNIDPRRHLHVGLVREDDGRRRIFGEGVHELIVKRV